MWIKQLIGRLAGQVVDLPFSAAENVLANGTGVLATDTEVIAAGFDPVPVVAPVRTDVLPIGYRAEPTEVGGFDLYDAAGALVNVEPLANMIVAIEAAHDHREAVFLPVQTIPVGQLPPELPIPPRITTADYSFDPIDSGGFDVFDPAGLKINDGPVADEAAVRAMVLLHLAQATGRTAEQVEADELEEPPVVETTVPDDWRTLHWSQRKALALRINGGAPVANAAEADHVIEEYLTRP
jgi:hypothetical protein